MDIEINIEPRENVLEALGVTRAQFDGALECTLLTGLNFLDQ